MNTLRRYIIGSWNKTCGLSGLHISSGDDVFVFLLQENTDRSERCYATAFWKPLLLPFHSKYNDYGGGEESSGVAFPFIIDAVAKNLDEVDIGANRCHDIAVKRDGFSEEQFFESVHEYRLKTRGEALDFVMFRKDIVDDIIKNWVQQDYVGDGSGDCGYSNNYRKVTFDIILADMPEFIARFEKACQLDDPDDSIEKAHFIYKMSQSIGDIFEWKEKNLVARYLRNDSYRYCRLLSIGKIAGELMQSGQKDEAVELITEHLKGTFLDHFIGSTRKVWMPGGHEGSQASDLDGYEALIGAMSRAVAAEKTRYGNDDD